MRIIKALLLIVLMLLCIKNVIFFGVTKESYYGLMAIIQWLATNKVAEHYALDRYKQNTEVRPT